LGGAAQLLSLGVMNNLSLIAIIVLFVIATTLRHYFPRWRSKARVRRSSFDSKAKFKNAVIEEFRGRNQKRRDRFVQLGFRPLQVALWVSLLVYALSVLTAVIYYWQQVHLLGWLVLPALLVIFWSLQFTYARNQFMSNAMVTAFTLVLDYRHLIADDFRLVGSLARTMVVILGLVIYAKMKDPIFYRLHDAA
jgi:hypothetical protein